VQAEKIKLKESGHFITPDCPFIPYIPGDGIGSEIMDSARFVINEAVKKSYGDKRKISWIMMDAGEKAIQKGKDPLPEETVNKIREYCFALKGPLMTPVGGGMKSLNVRLRQELDLFACVRPIRWFPGLPAPVKNPQDVNMVIFRENTEDVYAGIEWQADSEEAEKMRAFLQKEFSVSLRDDAGIGVKPVSSYGSKRLVSAAVRYAFENSKRSVTLVHKGNIMKYTEGAFRNWGYEVAESEFPGEIVKEKNLSSGNPMKGKIVIKDRIADAMFQEILLHPSDYDVIATTNLNGDYLSDALAAQVGGLGIAPGANIGGFAAVFEATHGTAPNIAGKNMANPGSLILSGCMMLDRMNWKEASERVIKALEKVFAAGIVTVDLTPENPEKAKTTSEFTEELLKCL